MVRNELLLVKGKEATSVANSFIIFPNKLKCWVSTVSKEVTFSFLHKLRFVVKPMLLHKVGNTDCVKRGPAKPSPEVN